MADNHVLPNLGIFSHQAVGVEPFEINLAVLAADIVVDDTFVIGKFEAVNQKLVSLLLVLVAAGLDSNATEELAFALGVGDIDGVIDTSIIGSTVVTTESTEYLSTLKAPIDVSGKYLILEWTVAAATAADGTVNVHGGTLSGTRVNTANLSD